MRPTVRPERLPAPRVVRAVVVAVAVCIVAAPPFVWGAAPTAKGKAGKGDRAEHAYQAALELYRNGQYRAAIDKLEEARRLDPTAKELPYNLGMVHEKLGALDDAIRFFEQYVA